MDDIQQLTAQVATLVKTLVPSLESIERIAANGNGNGNGKHSSTIPGNEPSWPYGGIDTACDHKVFGEVIGELRIGMLELQSAVLGFGPAILRLETRNAHHNNRLEAQVAHLTSQVEALMSRIERRAA
jgi:hypothetical protein